MKKIFFIAIVFFVVSLWFYYHFNKFTFFENGTDNNTTSLQVSDKKPLLEKKESIIDDLCATKTFNNKEQFNLEYNRKNYLKELLLNEENNRTKLSLLANILLNAGISKVDFFGAMNLGSENLNAISKSLSTKKEASAVERMMLNNLINTLYFSFDDEKYENKLFSGLPLFLYVYSKTSGDYQDIFNLLIQNGYRPTIIDIALAIQKFNNNDYTLLLLNNIQNFYELNKHEKTLVKNISRYLTSNFKHKELSIWLSKTDHFLIQGILLNEFIDFPIPKETEKSNAIKTIEVLSDFDRKVNFVYTYNELVSWMPEKLIKKYDVVLNKESILTEVAIAISPSSKNIVEKLHKNEQKISLVKKWMFNCQLKLKNADLVSEKKLIVFLNKRKYLNRRFELGELYSAKVESSLAKIRDALYHSILKKNWEDVNYNINLLHGSELEKIALQSAMVHALISNAPIEVIDKLMKLGASLPADTILLIADVGYTNLANSLLDYGMDLHYEDKSGTNAIHDVVLDSYNRRSSSSAIAMLKFLISFNVNLSVNQHINALNLTLLKSEKYDLAIEFSKILLENGVVINNSHISQMKKLKKTDNERYLTIVQVLPELEISFVGNN